MNRRSFIKASAAAAAGYTILQPKILSGKEKISANDIIHIGFIGCGTQGIRQLMRHISNENIRIVAVCDPNYDSTDYIEWFDGELRSKIRAFLQDETWDENIAGCRAGMKPAKEIVDRYYAEIKGENGKPNCKMYEDYRDLLNDNNVDAVYVMTPDHHHSIIAVNAMKKGKHVIMHKPLATSVDEAKYVARIAAETGVATHMFCAESLHSTPLLCEWIWDGAIGDVTQVHNWSSRPVWPQGWTEYPREEKEIPDGLNWDLWLGPAEYRAYNPLYTHSLFRGWRDFGTGALGDMGHYSFRQIFQILKLGLPEKIEASANIVSKIEGNRWEEKKTDISFPHSSIIRFEFAERSGMPPVKLFWYDGSLRPEIPAELEIEKRKMPKEGMLIIGDKGKILADFNGNSPRIIPESQMQTYKRPEPYLNRPADGFDQWIEACKGGEPSSASFENVEKLTETVCLGNIALNYSEKLNYDPSENKIVNLEDANKYLSRTVRDQWKF